jgi:hypothetical protein
MNTSLDNFHISSFKIFYNNCLNVQLILKINLMKNFKFFFSILLITGVISQLAASGLNIQDQPYLSKEFTLEGKGNLEVRTSGGSIAVKGTNSNKVVVEMFVRRNGKNVDPQDAEVRKLLEEYNININKSGNKVSAISERKGNNWGNGRNNLSISFNVSVPETMSCNLNTSGGSINIQKWKYQYTGNNREH